MFSLGALSTRAQSKTWSPLVMPRPVSRKEAVPRPDKTAVSLRVKDYGRSVKGTWSCGRSRYLSDRTIRASPISPCWSIRYSKPSATVGRRASSGECARS